MKNNVESEKCIAKNREKSMKPYPFFSKALCLYLTTATVYTEFVLQMMSISNRASRKRQ